MTERPLEDRLAEHAQVPGMDPEFSEKLFSSTTRGIRWRRRRARIAQSAVVAIAFGAGVLATVSMTQSWTTVPPESSPAVAAGSTDPSSTVAADGGLGPELFDDPEALTFAYDAADDPGRLRLLKAAGDHELNVNQDIRAALEYYRRWVDLADASTRDRYDESDTWLLASLKHQE